MNASRRLLAATIAVLAAASFFASAPASAQLGPRGVTSEAPPAATLDSRRFFMPLDLRGRSQPTGIFVETGLVLRDIYHRDGSTLFEGTYQEIGWDLGVSPALLETGIHGEWMPVRVFKLRAEYHALMYYGTLGYMLSWDDADAAYGDEEADAREGEEEFGLGHRFSVQPTFQAKVGPIIIRNTTAFYTHFLGSFDGPYMRERLFDQLQAEHDGMVANTTVLAAEVWDGPGEAMAIVGPMYETVSTLTSGTGRQRVGGVAVVIPADRIGTLHRPRVYIQSGVNLRDQNRDGAFFIQGGFGIDIWFSDSLEND
jgi:hypothetical protein